MKNSIILLVTISALSLTACGPDAPCDRKCMNKRWSNSIYDDRQQVIRANEQLKKTLADAAVDGYAAESGVPATDYSEICVNHITYLQFQNGVTVEYDNDGRIKSCI